MKLDVTTRSGAVQITIDGKLDFEHVDQFEKCFTEKALNSGEVAIGIDLSKIEYIDSSGLGGMIKALNNAKNLGKNLYLFSASKKIQSVFTMARLDKFFTFVSPSEFKLKYPTEEEKEMGNALDSI